MITESQFTDYTGVTAPSNFNRLLNIAISMLAKYNVDNLSEECQTIYDNALMEQILFMMNKPVDNHKEVKNVSLGDASESYEVKETHNGLLSPIVVAMMTNSKCNFSYAGLKQGCKRVCF